VCKEHNQNISNTFTGRLLTKQTFTAKNIYRRNFKISFADTHNYTSQYVRQTYYKILEVTDANRTACNLSLCPVTVIESCYCPYIRLLCVSSTCVCCQNVCNSENSFYYSTQVKVSLNTTFIRRVHMIDVFIQRSAIHDTAIFVE
jgi:hypothetical protein